jgi:2-iminobutanoate/2-iminopropanoate deaminase
MKNPRRKFLTAGIGAAAVPAAATAATAGKAKVQGGVRMGNLFFSSGLTGTKAGNDIAAQTHEIMKAHKANLEALGSSLDNVLKVTAFLADVKNEKPAFNKAYAEYFSSKTAPARTALGGIFPDEETRVEIELVAWIP